MAGTAIVGQAFVRSVEEDLNPYRPHWSRRIPHSKVLQVNSAGSAVKLLELRETDGYPGD